MSSPSRSPSTGVIACGALTVDIEAIAERRGWDVRIYPLPPLLHNHPDRIAEAVTALIDEIRPQHTEVAVAYADCGTYGALDEVCAKQGVHRLSGSHCYDVYAGAEAISEATQEDPGTYFLTDFLAAGFDRLVWRELGLDRYPELRDDYFRHYSRVVWLAQRHTPDLERAAQRAADRLGLPLVITDVDTGEGGLESALADLLGREST